MLNDLIWNLLLFELEIESTKVYVLLYFLLVMKFSLGSSKKYNGVLLCTILKYGFYKIDFFDEHTFKTFLKDKFI